MKTRRSVRFQPQVGGTLEERSFQSALSFPAFVGPVATLGYRGNFVLTSRTFTQVQRNIDRTFNAFRNEYVRAFQRSGGDPNLLDFRLGTDDDGKLGEGPGQYRNGLLGRMDRALRAVEAKIPFGRGLAGRTGGVGLSTFTNPTSYLSGFAASAVEQLDEALNSGAATGSLQDALASIEQVRRNTLAVVPGYIATFGPGGSGDFGLKNN